MSNHLPFQKTVKQTIEIGGVGIHTGRYIEAKLHPASVDHGIVFSRNDISDRNPIIPATIDYAIPNRLCTRIENADGVGINTIEHFMAAFHGLGIDNLLIEIDGPEMPILDGSATQITELLHNAGIIEQETPKSVLVITRDVSVDLGDGVVARLSPADTLEIDINIDFQDEIIGKQSIHYVNADDAHFETELADSRTFCMLTDVEAIRNAGLGRGGSLDNAIVVHEGAVLNEGGLRHHDEFVRHKTLDCLGDLYLLGMSIKAKLTASKPGHFLSATLLKQVMASPDCFYIHKDERENNAVNNAGKDTSRSSSQWSYPETTYPEVAIALHR